MLYQSAHSLRADLWKCEDGENFSFPPHMHDSFEWITVTEGEMTVTVSGTSYALCEGEALLIFPNQVHALQTPAHSRHFLCIFSADLVQTYAKGVKAHVPASARFRPSPFYVERLISYAHQSAPSRISVKGVLYDLCGEFDSVAEYMPRREGENGLLSEIFRFVEEHHEKDCSLSALSAHTGYHYVYLSRYFKGCTGLSFTAYVNRYRVNEASYLLKSTAQTVLQISMECGFDSLRSFNRNFKEIMGVSPAEYRLK